MTSRTLTTRYFIALALVVLGVAALAAVLSAPSSQAAASASTTTTRAAVAIPTIPTGSEPLPPGVTVETFTPNLGFAIAMAFDPSDPSRLFYTEKGGRVSLIINGVRQANAVINFSVSTSSERGLLGIAMDPDFGNSNRYIYVYYTTAAPTADCSVVENRVVRFEENNGTGTNPTRIFFSCQSAGNHVGGNIHFGPDGKLYISVGDNANAANSQILTVKQGKMHRINSDGTIPGDNPPFPGPNPVPSLYAIGLRNSFDFAFDPVDTTAPWRIFGSENGPGCDDEMNRIEAGYNYGWRASYPCDDGATNGPDPAFNTIPPLWFLPTGACCNAPTGITVYSGPNIPQWEDELFMCAYSTGAMYHFYLNGDRTLATNTNIVQGVTCNTDIETGPDGNLYYIQGGGYSNGTLRRIVGTGGGGTPTNTAVPTNTTVPSITPVPPTVTIPALTNTPAATVTGVPPTGTSVPSSTSVPPSMTAIPTLTGTPGTPMPPSATSVSTQTATSQPPTATPTTCTMPFSDVPPSDPFYEFIRCLYCRGIIGGYDDGTFRPYNSITRGQISKIVSESAGFQEPVEGQTYTDVPPNQTFYTWIERLTSRGIMGGYPCGGVGEPCDPLGRPYFRPFANATRAHLSKIVSNTAGYNDPVSGQFYADVDETNPFYVEIMRLTNRGVMSGYQCGGAGEPCDEEQRPYFRWGRQVTRGQASKIVVNTFFGSCPTPPEGTENVDIILYEYEPQTITVTSGTIVRWYNYDLDYHTSTSGTCDGNDCTPDGRFDTGNINQYESSAVTLTTPGTYHYYCRPHPYMQADVIVVAP